MLLFAKHVFQLGEKQPDGATLREHLEQTARQTGVEPPELIPPEIADEVAYIWEFYREIGRGREYGRALSCSDIDAWQKVSGIELTAFESSVIMAIDDAYLEHAKEVLDRQRRREQNEARRQAGRR